MPEDITVNFYALHLMCNRIKNDPYRSRVVFVVKAFGGGEMNMTLDKSRFSRKYFKE